MKDKVKGYGIGKVKKYKVPKDILEKIHNGDSNAEKEYMGKIKEGIVKPYEENLTHINDWFSTGWNEILELITGASSDHFDNTNAQIGVGNDSTAFSDSQNGLVGTSTSYKGMESGYPSTPASGQVIFQAQFGTSDANFTWEEWCVKNSASGVVWNRALTGGGATWTKDNTEIWTFEVTLGKA